MKEQNSPEGPKRTVYPMQIDSSQQDALVGTITSSESLVTSESMTCIFHQEFKFFVFIHFMYVYTVHLHSTTLWQLENNLAFNVI